MTAYKQMINGELVIGGCPVELRSSATGQVFAACSNASEVQLNQAIASAKSAFPAWSVTPLEQRATAIAKIADMIVAHCNELGTILAKEIGKPLACAMGEVFALAEYCRYFCTLDIQEQDFENTGVGGFETHPRRVGVVSAIVPKQFPLALMAFKVPSSLLAGNTLVLMPSSATPLATLRIGELIKDIFPAGVINVISGESDLGEMLTSHTDVAKTSFKESTAMGAKVMMEAAKLLTSHYRTCWLNVD